MADPLKLDVLLKPRPPHPLDDNPSWTKDAACKGKTKDFYPGRGVSTAHMQRIKAICAECPIRIPCLQYALHHNETRGIWGGLSPDERKPFMRSRTNRD